jgi:hypothetical protein
LQAGGWDDAFTLSDAAYSVLVAAAPTAGPTSDATPTTAPTSESTPTPTVEATATPSPAASPSPEATATAAPTATPVPEPWGATSSVPVWLTALIALAFGGGGFLLGTRSGSRKADQA